MLEKIYRRLKEKRLLLEADAIGFLNPIAGICIFSYTTGGYSLSRIGGDGFLEPIAPEELPQAMREFAASLMEAADEIEKLLAEGGEE